MKVIWLAICQALLIPLAVVSTAHELNPSIADLSFGEGELRIALEVNAEALLAGVGPEHADTNDSPEAAIYDQFRRMEADALLDAIDAFAPTLTDGIAVTVDGIELPLSFTGALIPPAGDVSVPRLTALSLVGTLPEGADAITMGWDAVFGQIVVRTVATGEGSYAALLAGGETSGPIAVPKDAFPSKLPNGWIVAAVLGAVAIAGSALLARRKVA